MEYRRCGNGDLELSVIGLGCWSFGGEKDDYWGAQDQTQVNVVVRKAFELGVNYFDTAEGYNDGRSEESLALAIRDLPRDEIVVGSKVAPSNVHPEVLREHCEQSLKRLKTDYLDVYMVHWPIHLHAIKFHTDDENILNNPPSPPEAFDTLLSLRREGKIRYIGVSNFGVGPLEEALGTAPDIAVNQLAYSLISRAIEWEILPFCQSHNIGVMAYMPLWQGLLTDGFLNLDSLPAVRRRTRHFDSRRSPLARHGEQGAEAETRETLEAVRRLAAETGLPLAQLSLAWSVAHPGITTAVVGARDLEQLESNVAAGEIEIGPEIVARMNELSQALKEKLGPSFDYFEATATDRTRYSTSKPSTT